MATNETGDGNALVVRGVTKSYKQGDAVEHVLNGIDLDVASGRFVAIMGPSGSGKSTLLHLLGGLDAPDAGTVSLGGTALSSMSDDDRARLRRDRVGIVYQFFNLIPVLTVAENIALPAVIAGASAGSYDDRLKRAIEQVGLTSHRGKQPSQLSGGQQQRAAIARAVFIEPTVLLADEPTGNLDFKTGSEILGLFAEQADAGQTIVMVTHDPRSAAYADEVLLLREGLVTERLDVTSAAGGDGDRAAESRRLAVLRWLEATEGGAESVSSRAAANQRSNGAARKAPVSRKTAVEKTAAKKAPAARKTVAKKPAAVRKGN